MQHFSTAHAPIPVHSVAEAIFLHWGQAVFYSNGIVVWSKPSSSQWPSPVQNEHIKGKTVQVNELNWTTASFVEGLQYSKNAAGQANGQ